MIDTTMIFWNGLIGFFVGDASEPYWQMDFTMYRCFLHNFCWTLSCRSMNFDVDPTTYRYLSALLDCNTIVHLTIISSY